MSLYIPDTDNRIEDDIDGIAANFTTLESNLPVAADVTVTVGAAGDYITINAALEALTLKYPTYKAEGHTVEISLLTGFVMAEQVLARGVDLGWIVITSVDAEVTITRSALTTAFFARHPAFGAYENATLPTIGALFTMDASGTATDRDGFFITHRSSVNFRPGAGCKNAGSRGLHVSNNSMANARQTIFDGATTFCFRVSNGSFVAARNATGLNAGDIGAAISASIFEASYADLSDSTGVGALIDDGSRFGFLDGVAENCGGIAVHVKNGSTGHLDGASLIGAGSHGVFAENGSAINAKDAIANSVTGTAFYAATGSRINAEGVTGTGSGESGIIAASSSTINAANSNVSGATTNGALAIDGSFINLRNTNCRKGATDATEDIVVSRGSIIASSGSTGGLSHTVNTIQAAGIIFG